MRFTIGVVLGMLVGLMEVPFLIMTRRRRPLPCKNGGAE